MPDANTFHPLALIRRLAADIGRVQLDFLLTQSHLLLLERLPCIPMGCAVANSHVVPIASRKLEIIGLVGCVMRCSQRRHEIGAIVTQRFFFCFDNILLVDLPIIWVTEALEKVTVALERKPVTCIEYIR